MTDGCEVSEGRSRGLIVFVADHAEDDMKVGSGLLGELTDDILDAGGIVTGIADEGGMILQLLPAAT